MLKYFSNSSWCIAVLGGQSAGRSSNMFVVNIEAIFKEVFWVQKELVSKVLNAKIIINAP